MCSLSFPGRSFYQLLVLEETCEGISHSEQVGDQQS